MCAIKRILNETLAHCASGAPCCPAKRPSDKVDCSISVTILGGVSAAANAQASINDRNTKSCLDLSRRRKMHLFSGHRMRERLVAEVSEWNDSDSLSARRTID